MAAEKIWKGIAIGADPVFGLLFEFGRMFDWIWFDLIWFDWIGLDWIGNISGLVDRGFGPADEVANTVGIK